MQTIIRVEKLNKTFNQHQVLHAIDLNVHAGEMVRSAWAIRFLANPPLLRHLSGPDCRR
ncbi:phosphonate/organophosphate ester transporter subunit [Kluyvera cryocrescens]|uniref:Phosphonate/organophosphate ester transporter subunit n=1 Tax=Kluyvera cryocrescens TaxID=580 RepID=A0A485A4R1_KLUCR|nr:phosphonate/organophosphate ester transporter subunit [Kluyvera cryocrescens]